MPIPEQSCGTCAIVSNGKWLQEASSVISLSTPCLYQVAQEPLFVWTDLSEQDLQSLWQSGLESPKSAAILQKAAIQSQNRTELQQQTELELYKQTLRQGKVLLVICVVGIVWMRFVLIGSTSQDMCLADKQLSALFSLVKNVHTDAVAKRLTIDRSFDCFKQILLRHSVQRCTYLEAIRSAHARCYAQALQCCAGRHIAWVFSPWCKLRLSPSGC